MGGRSGMLSLKGQKVPPWSYLHWMDVVQLLCSYSSSHSSGTNNMWSPDQDSLTESGAEGLLFLQGHPNKWLKHGFCTRIFKRLWGSCVTEVPYSALTLMEIINSSKSTRRKKYMQINKGHKTQTKASGFPRRLVVPPILLRNRGTPGTATQASLPALCIWPMQWSVLHNLSTVTNFSPEIVRPPLSDVAVEKIPAFASLDPAALRAELPSLLIIPKFL